MGREQKNAQKYPSSRDSRREVSDSPGVWLLDRAWNDETDIWRFCSAVECLAEAGVEVGRYAELASAMAYTHRDLGVDLGDTPSKPPSADEYLSKQVLTPLDIASEFGLGAHQIIANVCYSVLTVGPLWPSWDLWLRAMAKSAAKIGWEAAPLLEMLTQSWFDDAWELEDNVAYDATGQFLEFLFDNDFDSARDTLERLRLQVSTEMEAESE